MRPRLTRSLSLAFVLLSAAILGAGCGSSGNDDADPAKVMPAGSLFSLTATIRPQGDQRHQLEGALKKELLMTRLAIGLR